MGDVLLWLGFVALVVVGHIVAGLRWARRGRK